MKKLDWEGIRMSLNPLYIVRRYRVEQSRYAMSHATWFWRLSDAMRFFESVRHSEPCVELIDEWFTDGVRDRLNGGNVVIDVADNRDKMPPPPMRTNGNYTAEERELIWQGGTRP